MSSYNDAVLSYVDVGTDDCRVDDGIFSNENVIADVKGKECDSVVDKND